MLRQYGNFPSHLLSFQRGLFGFPTLRLMNLTNNNNNKSKEVTGSVGKTLRSIVKLRYTNQYLKLHRDYWGTTYRTADWLTCKDTTRQPSSSPFVLTMKLIYGWAFFRNQVTNLRGRSSAEAGDGCPCCGKNETGPEHMGSCSHVVQQTTRQTFSALRKQIWDEPKLDDRNKAMLANMEDLPEGNWRQPRSDDPILDDDSNGLRALLLNFGSDAYRRGIWQIEIREGLQHLGVTEEQAVRALSKIRTLHQAELSTLYRNRCKEAHRKSQLSQKTKNRGYSTHRRANGHKTKTYPFRPQRADPGDDRREDARQKRANKKRLMDLFMNMKKRGKTDANGSDGCTGVSADTGAASDGDSNKPCDGEAPDYNGDNAHSDGYANISSDSDGYASISTDSSGDADGTTPNLDDDGGSTYDDDNIIHPDIADNIHHDDTNNDSPITDNNDNNVLHNDAMSQGNAQCRRHGNTHEGGDTSDVPRLKLRRRKNNTKKTTTAGPQRKESSHRATGQLDTPPAGAYGPTTERPPQTATTHKPTDTNGAAQRQAEAYYQLQGD